MCVCVCGGTAVPADWLSSGSTRERGSRSGGRRNAGTAEPVRKRHEGLRRDPAQPKRQRKETGNGRVGPKELEVESECWKASTVVVQSKQKVAV